MCAITLTVLQTCKHELPTIEYCPDATAQLKKFHKQRELGVNAPPPEACTDSLGWTIFKRVEAPVLCEGCKMWLFLNGKRTYGSIVGSSQSETKPGGDATEANILGEKAKDNIESGVMAEASKAMEMEKLRSGLSRQFGVTGQRPKRPTF